MKEYIVRGEDRATNAIGIFEPFQVRITAESKDDASEKVRTQRYDANREHVHIKAVAEIVPDPEEC